MTISYTLMQCTLTVTLDLDVFTKIACLALNLNTVMKVLLEGSAVEDLVVRRLRVVDDELVFSGGFSGSGLGLHGRGRREEGNRREPTEKVTQQSGNRD